MSGNQRKTNGFRIESRNRKTRAEHGGNQFGMGHGGSSNAYIPTSDMGNMPISSQRAQNDGFKMSRNESKSSANFSKD